LVGLNPDIFFLIPLSFFVQNEKTTLDDGNKTENKKMAASSFGGEGGAFGSINVHDNFNVGTRIFVKSLSNLSIPVGEEIQVPIVLSMEKYSKYYVYYIIDQDILLTVDWFNSAKRGFVREKTVALTASSPDGAFLEGRVQARKLQVRFTNNAIAGPGSDITEIYVAVFAIQ
jgi:hypothetical protein